VHCFYCKHGCQRTNDWDKCATECKEYFHLNVEMSRINQVESNLHLKISKTLHVACVELFNRLILVKFQLQIHFFILETEPFLIKLHRASHYSCVTIHANNFVTQMRREILRSREPALVINQLQHQNELQRNVAKRYCSRWIYLFSICTIFFLPRSFLYRIIFPLNKQLDSRLDTFMPSSSPGP